MLKKTIASVLKVFGVDCQKLQENICMWSLRQSIRENNYGDMVKKLITIVPDLSEQYSLSEEHYSSYVELKLRVQHAFQCVMMFKGLESLPAGKLTVVDIGDSAGTHMRYVQALTKDRFDIDTISVNLDPRAIEKIKAKGLKAILSRAEDMDLTGRQVDLFTSFEMVEHLHNPAIFFRRLAKKTSCNQMVMTVPYVRESRVSLLNSRDGSDNKIFAEDEHVFELSPRDWTNLLLHGGWKVRYNRIYYQYPRRIPLVSTFLSWYWKRVDFEGFWGVVLEKDTTVSDRYQDWGE